MGSAPGASCGVPSAAELVSDGPERAERRLRDLRISQGTGRAALSGALDLSAALVRTAWETLAPATATGRADSHACAEPTERSEDNEPWTSAGQLVEAACAVQPWESELGAWEVLGLRLAVCLVATSGCPLENVDVPRCFVVGVDKDPDIRKEAQEVYHRSLLMAADSGALHPRRLAHLLDRDTITPALDSADPAAVQRFTRRCLAAPPERVDLAGALALAARAGSLRAAAAALIEPGSSGQHSTPDDGDESNNKKRGVLRALLPAVLGSGSASGAGAATDGDALACLRLAAPLVDGEAGCLRTPPGVLLDGAQIGRAFELVVPRVFGAAMQAGGRKSRSRQGLMHGSDATVVDVLADLFWLQAAWSAGPGRGAGSEETERVTRGAVLAGAAFLCTLRAADLDSELFHERLGDSYTFEVVVSAAQQAIRGCVAPDAAPAAAPPARETPDAAAAMQRACARLQRASVAAVASCFEHVDVDRVARATGLLQLGQAAFHAMVTAAGDAVPSGMLAGGKDDARAMLAAACLNLHARRDDGGAGGDAQSRPRSDAHGYRSDLLRIAGLCRARHTAHEPSRDSPWQLIDARAVQCLFDMLPHIDISTVGSAKESSTTSPLEAHRDLLPPRMRPALCRALACLAAVAMARSASAKHPPLTALARTGLRSLSAHLEALCGLTHARCEAAMPRDVRQAEVLLTSALRELRACDASNVRRDAADDSDSDGILALTAALVAAVACAAGRGGAWHGIRDGLTQAFSYIKTPPPPCATTVGASARISDLAAALGQPHVDTAAPEPIPAAHAASLAAALSVVTAKAGAPHAGAHSALRSLHTALSRICAAMHRDHNATGKNSDARESAGDDADDASNAEERDAAEEDADVVATCPLAGYLSGALAGARAARGARGGGGAEEGGDGRRRESGGGAREEGRKEKARRRARRRSANPFVDAALNEGGSDADDYADLDDFIVCKPGRDYETFRKP
ncbi:unnamed protein product [Pedinophyceae sp. YPF-701]|nr:unnamed protein product [Pedinophyceae sp. YPF-701]